MGIELNNDQIYAVYDLEHWWHKSTKQVFEISGAAGTGKAQPLTTKIPTPNGIKELGELEVGDYVFDRNGEPTKVLGIYDKGALDAYEITFEDGRKSICNNEHLWGYYKSCHGKQKYFVGTLQEIMDYGIYKKDSEGKITYTVSIPRANTVKYDTKNFEIDPYDIGNITHNRIPNEYMYGDIQQRWDLVQGLFDINGSISYENYDITYSSVNIDLLYDIKLLLTSLGCTSTISESMTDDSKNNNRYYTLNVQVENSVKPSFFRLKRKKDIAIISTIMTENHDYSKIKIYNIKKLDKKIPMRCIYVDNDDHLYLSDEYIVTHNTTLIRYFIERLGIDYENVLFVAYMGKAASQMARNGLPAKTIHSAIYDFKEKFDRDENGKVIIKSNGKPKLISFFDLKSHISKKIKLIVLDEGSMVDERIAKDLLSFNIPVIVLGDLNQLPPVFGNSYFLRSPDVILRQIMRQAENNPIIWLSQQVLAGEKLHIGVYGNSSVISKSDITEYHFRHADVILTGTNRLRYNINSYCRETIKGIKKLEYPHVGEKVICRKNNWNQCIGDNIYLTNGTAGFVDFIYRDSYNKKTMKMDFRPDFTNKVFHNIEFDYNHMYEIPGQEQPDANKFGFMYDKMEYAYAITVHSSQGSQYPGVMYLHEDFMRNNEDRKRLLYTAITRAEQWITVVL